MNPRIEKSPVATHEEVLIQLRRIARAMDVYSKQLQKSGITSSQLAVLRALAAQGPMTANRLSRAVELSQGTVTTVLDRLDRKGLIQRSRREDDKRQVWLNLTEAGAQAFNDAPSPLHLDFVKGFSQLQDWEQTMILAALQRVAGLMDIPHEEKQKRRRAVQPRLEPLLELALREPEPEESGF